MTPWGAEEEIDNQALFGRTILQVAPALDASPAGIACVEIAASLAEAGARALVAGPPGRLVSELQARGGVFLPFAAATINPWKAMLDRRLLERLVIREGVELIHVHAAPGAQAAHYAARRARIPLVADFEPGHGDLALEADSIVVFSRAAFEEGVKARPEKASRFIHGIRGVDLRRFTPEAVDGSRTRRLRGALGVKAHERLILGVGLSSDQRKLFLAAAAQLQAKGFLVNDNHEIRFVWLRREADEAAAKAFADETEKMGLTGAALQILGDDRAAACLAAALVVVPAGEPGLCIEAQALGAPVALLQPVGAREAADSVEGVCAPPQVEASLRTGWTIPANQPQFLARAVEESVRLGATSRESFAQRARAHARNFSTERMCALILGVYARHFSGGQT
jgi:glycosyltransferase involved in cell wall biosynthesis